MYDYHSHKNALFKMHHKKNHDMFDCISVALNFYVSMWYAIGIFATVNRHYVTQKLYAKDNTSILSKGLKRSLAVMLHICVRTIHYLLGAS